MRVIPVSFSNCYIYIPLFSPLPSLPPSPAVYHNAKVKYCKTNIELERRVKGQKTSVTKVETVNIVVVLLSCVLGHGLRCHRSVSAVCQLAGIKDMRAKVTGSNNPLNTVRATFKGLTSQVRDNVVQNPVSFVSLCRSHS